MNAFHSQEDFDLVEGYLTGGLDPEKQEEIRLRIRSDQEFASFVQEIRDLQLGLERAALASRLESFHAEIREEDGEIPVRALSRSGFWWIAASLFLAISAGAWWLMGRRSPGEELYQAYYQVDPGLVTSMSGEGNYDFDRAMVDYKSGEYGKAKTAFESLLKGSSQNDTVIYFLAMTELNLQNEQPAEKLLLAVAEDTGSGFSKDSFWYLGLLALREEDYALAKTYLGQSGRAKSEELIQAIEEVSGK